MHSCSPTHPPRLARCVPCGLCAGCVATQCGFHVCVCVCVVCVLCVGVTTRCMVATGGSHLGEARFRGVDRPNGQVRFPIKHPHSEAMVSLTRGVCVRVCAYVCVTDTAKQRSGRSRMVYQPPPTLHPPLQLIPSRQRLPALRQLRRVRLAHQLPPPRRTPLVHQLLRALPQLRPILLAHRLPPLRLHPTPLAHQLPPLRLRPTPLAHQLLAPRPTRSRLRQRVLRPRLSAHPLPPQRPRHRPSRRRLELPPTRSARRRLPLLRRPSVHRPASCQPTWWPCTRRGCSSSSRRSGSRARRRKWMPSGRSGARRCGRRLPRSTPVCPAWCGGCGAHLFVCCGQQIPPVCGHDWSDAAAAVCGCTRTRASRARVRVPAACVDWLRCCKPLRHAGHSWWRVRRDAFRFASCGAGAGACGGCVTIRRCCCCRDGWLWQFRWRRLGFGGAQRGVCQPIWATPQVGRGVDAVARG